MVHLNSVHQGFRGRNPRKCSQRVAVQSDIERGSYGGRLWDGKRVCSHVFPSFCTHSLSLTEASRQILNSEEAKPLVLSLRALKKLALVVEKFIFYVLSHFSHCNQ